jgi:hypothetical protein
LIVLAFFYKGRLIPMLIQFFGKESSDWAMPFKQEKSGFSKDCTSLQRTWTQNRV